jgi:enoyl-CoA hydratase/carnithine racemase
MTAPATPADTRPSSDIAIHRNGHTATVELCRPPHNFFDFALIAGLADAFEALQADPECRVIVLAVQGPAVGGGLGLALVADFRVTCAEARFSANFARLGFHPGFALSCTLPRLVGPQQAALLLYTGRRVNGEEAVRIGLADELVAQDQVRARAQALAEEIAASAPIAVESVRASLRAGLVDAVRAAVEREAGEQRLHFQTRDFREGVAATAQRREPVFGRH